MNIWTGLLFLEGAVVDASLARELASGDEPPAVHAPTRRTDETGVARATPAAERWSAGAAHY